MPKGPKLGGKELALPAVAESTPIFKPGSMFVCLKKDRWVHARCSQCDCSVSHPRTNKLRKGLPQNNG